MSLELVETFLRWVGGLLADTVLGIVLLGIWRGTRRPSGRTSGRAAGWLRSALFYLLATICFLDHTGPESRLHDIRLHTIRVE
jgi:hypothetical protein